MKNKVCIKKIVVCFVLIIIVGVQSIDSSYATEWYHAFSPLAVFIDKMAEAKDAQALEDAISLGYSFWRSSPSSNYAVPLSRDTLDELCAELNQAGFPCYVGYRADVYGGAYCIVGNGYLTVSSNSYADRKFNISGRVYTNSDGEAYLSDVSYTSNDYLERVDANLQNILNKLDPDTDPDDGVGYWIYQIALNLIDISNKLDNLSISGGSLDVSPIVNKLQEVVDALDTTSVTDKLQEVVDALDTTSVTDKLQEIITTIQGSSTPIVGELQNIFKRLMAVDFATNERVDALLAEIQKISTHADFKEVVTVAPGVLGDVEVSTASDWRYEDLIFYYEPAERFVPDGSSEWTLNTDNLWVDDDGSASLDHVTRDFNTWGGTDVAISLTDEFYARMEDLPDFYLEFVESGGYTVFTVSSQELLSGPLYYSVYSPADIFCIRIVFPSDAYVLQSGMGFDLLTLKYGSYEAPMTSQLSFTADGVPHTLYWWNEYEFTSDGTLWSGIFLRYTDGHWYLEDSSGTVWPVLYYDAYLTEALTSAPTTVTTVEEETYTWFEWFYTSYGKGGFGGGSDLTPLVMRLDTIIENLNATVGVAGCNHTYRDELDQEPTCILPGLMNHICSQCGSCYSEIVPSLGHNWEHKGYTNEQLNMDGEIIQQAHHLFECRRCGELFYDFQNVGDPDAVPNAPAKESDSLSSIIARLFEKLGNFAGELLSGIIKLLDKLLTGFDDVVTGFNEKAEQIATVGGDYPQWLSGVWGIIPADLQLVLTFCVIAMCVAVIGKKIFFVS